MGDDPSKAQKQKADQRNGIKDKSSPVAATAVQNQDVPAQRVSEGQQAEKQGDDRVAPTRPVNEPHTEQAPNVVVANQSQRQPMQNKGAAEPKEKAAQQTAKGPQPEKISQEATSDAQKAQAPAPARAAPAPAPAETVPQPTASTSTAPAPASASPAPAQRPAKKAPKRDRQKANRDKTAGSQAPAPAGQQQKASSTDANSQSNVATTGANRTQQVTGLTANELLQRELMNALAAGNIALAGSITMSIVQNQMMGQTCNSSLADANQRFGSGSLGSNHVLSQGGQVPIELSQQHVGMGCAPNVGSQGSAIPNSNTEAANSLIVSGTSIKRTDGIPTKSWLSDDRPSHVNSYAHTVSRTADTANAWSGADGLEPGITRNTRSRKLRYAAYNRWHGTWDADGSTANATNIPCTAGSGSGYSICAIDLRRSRYKWTGAADDGGIRASSDGSNSDANAADGFFSGTIIHAKCKWSGQCTFAVA